MRLRKWDAMILGGLSALACQGVLADTGTPASSPPTTVSTTEEKSVWDKISEKAALSYFGIYRGASLGNPGNSMQPTTTGDLDPTSPQSLESYVTGGYKINKDLMVGVASHFFYSPLGMPQTVTSNYGSGPNFQMWDPSLVIAKSNMVDSDGLKITGKLFVQLPLTSVDILQRQGDSFAVSPTFIINYDVPKTALTVGAYTYVTAYLPGSNLSDTARSYKIYVAPTANYQLTKTVAVSLWVDLIQATRNRGTGFVSGMSNATADIEPGISWDITDKITLNPMINIYPSMPTLAATSLQAVLIAKAF